MNNEEFRNDIIYNNEYSDYLYISYLIFAFESLKI